MPKMTKEELQRRKADMSTRARAEVAKTEIMQFRLDAANIERLYAQSAKCKMPVGTMVRQWVLERLATEEGNNVKPEEIRDILAGLLEKQNRMCDLLSSLDLPHKELSVAPPPASIILQTVVSISQETEGAQKAHN